MSGEICTDNRFEIIAAYKKKLIEGTNIQTNPEEMAVIDNILFRFWQMRWLPPIPHGRLIDADAFAAEMKKRQEEAGKWLREAKDRETAVRADAVLSFLCEVKLTLDAAPTIIKAEEGE